MSSIFLKKSSRVSAKKYTLAHFSSINTTNTTAATGSHFQAVDGSYALFLLDSYKAIHF